MLCFACWTQLVLTWCLNTFLGACLAAPTEVAQGAASPIETKAQAPDNSSSQSAASLSGAGPASDLPQVHPQAAQAAAPAKPAAQPSTEAERTAPPAPAPAQAPSSPTVSDSASSAAAGTTSPSAGMLQHLRVCVPMKAIV